MAPKGWTTAEERDFLKSYLPEYEACMVERRYKSFWQRLNVDYFTAFPMLEKTFPGRNVGDLSQDEKVLYSEGIARQQKRLKEWFRWQMNPRSSRNAAGRKACKDLHIVHVVCDRHTRRKKPYEVFAKLYPSEVDEEKVARCESRGIKGRQQLSVWHEVAKELYRAATEEQLAAVKKEMDLANEIKGGVDAAPEDGPGSPSTYIRLVHL